MIPAGKFEFEMYLVHQTFILGPFALVDITVSRELNIIIAITAIIVSTYLFCVFKEGVMNHVIPSIPYLKRSLNND